LPFEGEGGLCLFDLGQRFSILHKIRELTGRSLSVFPRKQAASARDYLVDDVRS
jgi:hypothetical protein